MTLYSELFKEGKMSRDFDDIVKRINQSHKELYKQDAEIAKDLTDLTKNQDKILKEIIDLKKDIKNIDSKINEALDIISSLTIMFVDDEEIEDEDEDNIYDTDTTWVPDEDDEWKNSADDDEY